MSKIYEWSELQYHNKPEDLFIVFRGSVYDVTKFQNEHPGGPKFLLDQGGGDATELFEDAGHSDEARSIMKKLKIGVVEEGKTNGTQEISSQQPIGSLASFELRRHTIPTIFFLVLGLLFHYYYRNSSNKVWPTWREFLLAPN